MRQIPKISQRWLFLKIHRFVGIIIGILLIIIGTTGSLLVFHNELEAAIHPQLITVVPEGERLSVDAITASVQQADPNAQLEFILLPQQSEESVKVKVNSGDREIAAFVDPYTGAILGWWGFDNIFTHFLLKIRTSLLVGKIGKFIVGACGLLLLILCLTGLALWTGKRRIMRAFKIRWNAPLRLLAYDFHQVSGIVAVLFLVLYHLPKVVR
ncbi:MAG: PepSY-associated TM helix domain-containing protein [Cyanophyceae cyanobacterium]